MYLSRNRVRLIKSGRSRRLGIRTILTGKPTGKGPLESPSRRWKSIIINIMNWVDSAQDRDYWRASVCAALNQRVP